VHCYNTISGIQALATFIERASKSTPDQHKTDEGWAWHTSLLESEQAEGLDHLYSIQNQTLIHFKKI